MNRRTECAEREAPANDREQHGRFHAVDLLLVDVKLVGEVGHAKAPCYRRCEMIWITYLVRNSLTWIKLLTNKTVPAHSQNRHRRAFVRRYPSRQSKRPIPRLTRAAGSGVQSARKRTSVMAVTDPFSADRYAWAKFCSASWRCWVKRHGEYYNDHRHHSCGGCCCCRSPLD
jgi:hypothetical protein